MRVAKRQRSPLDPRLPSRPCSSDGGELALIDLREELIFSRNHLLWARSIPLSRLELRFARLVPRLTPASCCATTATAWSSAPPSPRRRRLHRHLLSRWRHRRLGERPGSSCSPASTCRARRSANTSSTPATRRASSAEELDGLMRSGTDMVVVDSRPVRRIPARLDPERHQCAGRRAGAAHARHRAVAGDAGRGQLRRPHPQHHRRAIADQRRRAEQGGGAAQRHDGLDARRPDARQRQGEALRRSRRLAGSPGPSRPPSASRKSSA